MKTQLKKIATGAAAFGLAIVFTITTISPTFAQGKSLSGARLATNPDVVAPTSLPVALYQVENTTKLKLHFENYSGKDVTIKIRNAASQVVYQEKVEQPKKYIRKFDMKTLGDGAYTFEISNADETVIKEISLQTMLARRMDVNE